MVLIQQWQTAAIAEFLDKAIANLSSVGGLPEGALYRQTWHSCFISPMSVSPFRAFARVYRPNPGPSEFLMFSNSIPVAV